MAVITNWRKGPDFFSLDWARFLAQGRLTAVGARWRFATAT